jgi:hypothetical protein
VLTGGRSLWIYSVYFEFTGLVFEWVLLWVRFNFHRTLFFPSILSSFLLRPPPVLTLVYQSVNRLLSRISPGLSRAKPDLATKCRTKPQRGVVIFPAAVFLSQGLLHGMVICEFSTQLFRNVPVKLRAE